MGKVIWEGPVSRDGVRGDARAIRTATGTVLFEQSTRRDGLGVPVWEPLAQVPREFIEHAAGVMTPANLDDSTIIILPDNWQQEAGEAPEHRGGWKLKKRRSLLSRLTLGLL